MAGFDGIIGQDHIVSFLKRASVSGKVSHAYIIDGPRMSGKKMTADAFAMSLQCRRVNEKKRLLAGEDKISGPEIYFPEARKDKSFAAGASADSAAPCLECVSCRQAMGKNQPDIIYVTHEKPKTISVDDIREQINGDINIRPYSNPYKIYIVDEAEKMNPQAQNALLKTLEEPPSYAVIILLTTNSDSFLPTIRSRCVTLKIRPVPEYKIREYLMKNCSVPDYKAGVYAAFSQGNIGLAKQLAASQEFGKLRDDTAALASGITENGSGELERYIQPFLDKKNEAEEFFDLLLIWYRDVLLYKASSDEEKLIFSDCADRVSRQAKVISWEGLENIINAIGKAGVRVRANVNYELTLRLLMQEIKENAV